MSESRFEKLKKELQRDKCIEQSVISCPDFMTKDIPPNQWIVKDLIPVGYTILSSPPGQFKTYMLLELATQIALGERGFGHFELDKKNVLFINEEMGERSMQDRLKTLQNNPPGLFLTNLAGIKIVDMEYILEICKKREIGLVIIDSLTRIHNLSENDSDSVKKIFDAMMVLLKENISVIITHHHRKAPLFGQNRGSDELRGSTDLLAQVDCHLAIEKVSGDKKYIVMSQLKLRQAENIPNFKLDIIRNEEDKLSFRHSGSFSREDEQNIKIEEAKEPVLEVIKENPGITKNEILTKLNGKIADRVIRAVLPALEVDGVIFSKNKRPKDYYLKEEINGFFSPI